jgi:mono/diheme cytochrome c family protein
MGANPSTGSSLSTRTAAAVLISLVLAAITTSIQAQQDKLVQRGRFLYRVYCINCHGDNGRGDGVSAKLLRVPPTDLTRLSRDNPEQQDEFPFERVYGIIDGRQDVRGHGSRKMPIWGLTFQELDRDVDQEDEVRGKILQLIEYLKSIQQP